MEHNLSNQIAENFKKYLENVQRTDITDAENILALESIKEVLSKIEFPQNVLDNYGISKFFNEEIHFDMDDLEDIWNRFRKELVSYAESDYVEFIRKLLILDFHSFDDFKFLLVTKVIFYFLHTINDAVDTMKFAKDDPVFKDYNGKDLMKYYLSRSIHKISFEYKNFTYKDDIHELQLKSIFYALQGNFSKYSLDEIGAVLPIIVKRLYFQQDLSLTGGISLKHDPLLEEFYRMYFNRWKDYFLVDELQQIFSKLEEIKEEQIKHNDASENFKDLTEEKLAELIEKKKMMEEPLVLFTLIADKYNPNTYESNLKKFKKVFQKLIHLKKLPKYDIKIIESLVVNNNSEYRGKLDWLGTRTEFLILLNFLKIEKIINSYHIRVKSNSRFLINGEDLNLNENEISNALIELNKKYDYRESLTLNL